MNDRENSLVERVLSGDLSAFEPLVTPYRQALLGLAFRITRNSEDAKEVAQEAFLRAFKYLKSFDLSKDFKRWLFQIKFFERIEADNQVRSILLSRDMRSFSDIEVMIDQLLSQF